uniref:E3 ubiquitin-protein ligase TRIM39-like n=1 Tax=Callorhinchus milii TaxID=7868 RepID=A0A4W3HLR5_CALMI
MASNLECDLTCPICLDFYTDPVLTKCGHNFCRSCLLRCGEGELEEEDWDLQGAVVGEGQLDLEGEQDEEEPGGRIICCPQCRSEINLDDVYTNRQLVSVIQTLRNLYTSAQALRWTECKTHHEDLKLFCQDDWQPICLICALSQAHRQHKCVPINDAVAECKANLQEPLAFLEGKLKEYRSMQQLQGETITTYLNMTESLRAQVGEDLKAMHRFLDKQEEQLIQTLAEEEERVLRVMEENVALITRETENIKNIINDIQPWFNTHNPQHLLQVVYNSVFTTYDLVLNEPECNFGEFTGPLQYKVWKRMLGIIESVPAVIFFDPTTANPHLDLTSAGSKIQFRRKPHQIPSTPARFTHLTGVLASVGMDSGRHYWEVGIEEGTTWSVGVVTEAANRKTVLLPNPQDGFWVVGHQRGKGFWAYTAKKISLNPDENLERIGVFLDYKAGRLSFYDAEDMSHIFTFKETFKETLRPYFHLNNTEKTGNQPSMELFRLRL